MAAPIDIVWHTISIETAIYHEAADGCPPSAATQMWPIVADFLQPCILSDAGL
jgi:hypothetical protein